MLAGFVQADIPPAGHARNGSPTFRDILNRVIHRDKASGSILGVKPKPDAPQLGFGLTLRIEPRLRGHSR